MVYYTCDELTAESGESYFSYYFIPTNTSCMVLGLCSSRLELDGCLLQYGIDSTYSNLSPPIEGPINYPFSLPPLEEWTTYYYQASVVVERSFHVTLQGTLVVRDCDDQSRDDRLCQASDKLITIFP